MSPDYYSFNKPQSEFSQAKSYIYNQKLTLRSIKHSPDCYFRYVIVSSLCTKNKPGGYLKQIYTHECRGLFFFTTIEAQFCCTGWLCWIITRFVDVFLSSGSWEDPSQSQDSSWLIGFWQPVTAQRRYAGERGAAIIVLQPVLISSVRIFCFFYAVILNKAFRPSLRQSIFIDAG